MTGDVPRLWTVLFLHSTHVKGFVVAGALLPDVALMYAWAIVLDVWVAEIDSGQRSNNKSDSKNQSAVKCGLKRS